MKIDTHSAKREAAEHDSLERLETGYRCKNGWFEIRPRGKLPEKRSHHTGVIHQNFLYIFGGEDSREGKFDTLWQLNLDEFIEMQNKAAEDMSLEENKDLDDHDVDPDSPVRDNKLCWHQITTKGAIPGAISHHQSQIVEDEMYMFGGMQPDGESNPNLYSLNMKTFEWRIVHTEGDKPEARDDHSMAVSTTEK